MNKQKGFAKIILIIVGLILVSGVGYFLFMIFSPGQPYRPVPGQVQYTTVQEINECSKISMSGDDKNILSRVTNFFKPNTVSAMTQQILFGGKLCFLDKPQINKSSRLEFAFVSPFNLSEVTARIEVPESFEVVSGNSEWTGNLEGGKQKSFIITVKPTKVGYYQVKSFLTSVEGSGANLGSKQLNIDVTPKDTFVNFEYEHFTSEHGFLYTAYYPKHWTFRKNLDSGELFGYTLNDNSFSPIIGVSYFKTGTIMEKIGQVIKEQPIMLFLKNRYDSPDSTGMERKELPATLQTIKDGRGNLTKRVVITNYNGYDARITLLKPEYTLLFDKFYDIFRVLSMTQKELVEYKLSDGTPEQKEEVLTDLMSKIQKFKVATIPKEQQTDITSIAPYIPSVIRAILDGTSLPQHQDTGWGNVYHFAATVMNKFAYKINGVQREQDPRFGFYGSVGTADEAARKIVYDSWLKWWSDNRNKLN